MSDEQDKARAKHDATYRNLFAAPAMVRELIEAFVDPEIAALLDFERMEQLNAEFHTQSGQRRASDIIWKIERLEGEPFYRSY